jgi:Domain of unknown function (DUF5916)
VRSRTLAAIEHHGAVTLRAYEPKAIADVGDVPPGRHLPSIEGDGAARARQRRVGLPGGGQRACFVVGVRVAYRVDPSDVNRMPSARVVQERIKLQVLVFRPDTIGPPANLRQVDSYDMLISLLSVALATTLAGAGAGRTADGSGPAGRRYDGSAHDLEVETPSVDDAGIHVDGRLDDEAWKRAALLHSFTQYDPVEGVPASQKTEVLVLTDADAIYFGVRAFDDRPDDVRATLAQRDHVDRSDDYVRLVLDTFDDQRRAYVFSVNPLGVQQDGVWNEGGGGGHGHGPPIDDNPDFLWESDGRLTEWGWAVEVRIPFKSLRFPEVPEQSWGLQVIRRISRTGYEASWAPITHNISNQLTQAGKLTGLKNLDAGLFMELNPVLTGKRTGELDDSEVFQRNAPRGAFGLNVAYGLTSNLTLDATYNPDFSQVEADAGQISVNERFGLYFPEKRPFFLEGTEIFNLPKQVVYTRSIANPVGGAKLTGKMGAWNIGYIGAQDKAVSEDDYDAVANLVRVRRDLGAASTLGMVYTDRTVASDRYNRLLGGDARLVFAKRYTVTLFGAGSRTADPDSARAWNGLLWSARVDRAGRSVSFNTQVEDSDDGFEAGSGFLRRTGEAQLQSNLHVRRYGAPGALVESWGPSLQVHGFWDHDRFWSGLGPEEASTELGGDISFRGNVSVSTNLRWTTFHFQPKGYEELFVEGPDGGLSAFYPDQTPFRGLWGVDASAWVSTFDRIRGNVRVSWSQVPVFGGSNAAIEPADSYSADVGLNAYPTRSLQGEVGLRTSTIHRRSDGSRYSSALIPRIRAQYQFSRAFYVRGILEYASQERGALFDPASGLLLTWCGEDGCEEMTSSAAHDIHVEALVTYEPSPGTVFYVGYTRQMEDTRAFGFRGVTPVADGLFVKLSYRFRL